MQIYQCVSGDFNSRTGVKSDFNNVEYDENEIYVDVNDNTIYELQSLGLSSIRNSSDKFVNNYGNLLLNMCKSSNLLIFNGRINGNETGGFTCKDTSVVDYFIGSLDVIKQVSDMKILEHSMLYSDVHKPMSLELKSGYSDIAHHNNPPYNNGNNSTKIKHWDENKEHMFIDSIDMSALNEILEKLENMNEISTEIEINEITGMLNNTYIKAAKETFGEIEIIRKDNVQNKSKISRPWFTNECKKARKVYRKRKRIFSLTKTENTKIELKRSEKLYKKTMNRNIAKYRKDMRKKLKVMKTKDPKQY